MKNPIGWCDTTWNPMTGCTHVSEACEHCSERLDAPLHWRKPRRVFVCSMSDLFHEAFTDGQRDEVFAVMAACPQHCFLVLTKRPEEMRDYITKAMEEWPLPNVHLGVTVENQARADERIPILLDTPAAVRFVCCEPLLGPVDLATYLYGHPIDDDSRTRGFRIEKLDWLIVGGENGPGARQMKPEWALGVYRQCKAAGVPFWWKGPGAKGVGPYEPADTDDAIDMMCCHELPSVQP